MCFSASASFGAGALLLGTGIASVNKSRSPEMLSFASMPILFGVQQISEGILWVTLPNPDAVGFHDFNTYFYLVFAQVIWPVWIPLSLWLIEPSKNGKKIISYFLIFGILAAIYLIYCLWVYDASAVIEAHHIRYQVDIPGIGVKRALYVSATIIPLFISSLKWMRVLGATILGSLIFSFVVYTQYVISVWCFFAAIISVLVYLIVVSNKDLLIKSAQDLKEKKRKNTWLIKGDQQALRK